MNKEGQNLEEINKKKILNFGELSRSKVLLELRLSEIKPE